MQYLLLLSFVFLNSVNSSAEFIERSYCEKEEFTPSCEHDEVILVVNATYGRMTYGGCIKSPDIASNIGCNTSVLNFLHDKCSGKRSCSLKIIDFYFDYKKVCQSPGYLDVKYKCVKTITNMTGCLIDVTENSIITLPINQSHLDERKQCRELEISTPPGRAVQIDVVFVVSKLNEDRHGWISHSNGSIILMTTKTSYPLEVESSTLKITMDEGLSKMMLNITAHGCRDLLPRGVTVIQRNKNKVKLQCKYSNDVWSLTCAANESWVGETRECPEYSSYGAFSIQPVHVIVVITSVSVVVILCITCLIMIRKKRRLTKRPQRRGPQKEVAEFTYREGIQDIDDVDNNFSTIAHHQVVPSDVWALPPVLPYQLQTADSHELNKVPIVTASNMPIYKTTKQYSMTATRKPSKHHKQNPCATDCTCHTTGYSYNPNILHSYFSNPYNNFYGMPYDGRAQIESLYNYSNLPYFNNPTYPRHFPRNPQSDPFFGVPSYHKEDTGALYSTLEPNLTDEVFDLSNKPCATQPFENNYTEHLDARKKLALSKEDIAAAEEMPWEEMK